MGKITTPLTIINRLDQGNAERGLLPADQIRSVAVPSALVDTGATTLCLPSRMFRFSILRCRRRSFPASLCRGSARRECRLLASCRRRWEFNSTLFAVIANISGASAAKWICLFLFSIFYIYYAGRWHLNHTETIPRGDWVFGVFFLFSAVVNPWYLLWLLPFVAVFPSTPGVAALIVVTLSYVHGLNLPESGLRPYEHPLWVRWAEMVVLAAAGIAEVYVRRKPIP